MEHDQSAVEYRVNVVPKARIVPVFMRVQAATDFHVLFNNEDFLSRLAEIPGTDHPVVAGADDYTVVVEDFPHGCTPYRILATGRLISSFMSSLMICQAFRPEPAITASAGCVATPT